jgi:hypothetical protein
VRPTSPRVASPITQPKVKFTLAFFQGWKHPLPLCIGIALVQPLTPFSHSQPLSVTHQSLLTPGPTQRNPSPLPAPPAANTHLPSLPIGLLQPAPATEQHQSSMKTWATSLNGANCVPTPPSLSPGTPPMQTNWGAYAKASAPVPTKARASKAPTPSSHSLGQDPIQLPQRNHLLQGRLQGPTREERQCQLHVHHHWQKQHCISQRCRYPHGLN